MTAEHSSEEGGEGLSEAERESARRLIARDYDGWVYTEPAVERILADRLAVVQAERDRLRGLADMYLAEHDAQHARAESAEAERDDLRGRLAAVGSAVDCPHGPRHYYATDATCQRCEMPSWVEALFRAALANPSAAQGEGDR